MVENSPDQQRLFLNFLQDAGAGVELECDGFAAARRVRKSARLQEDFDAVVMDLVLEESDGIEATLAITETSPNLAIVAITANGNPEVEIAWRNAGAVDYLEKPITRDTLIESVCKSLTLMSLGKLCL